jgi:CspA family cold shock protein
MPIGTVKWFSATKRYGFIQPQGGGKDVFVHISAVERAGLSGLNEGQAIEFELVKLGKVLEWKMLSNGACQPCWTKSSLRAAFRFSVFRQLSYRRGASRDFFIKDLLVFPTQFGCPVIIFDQVSRRNAINRPADCADTILLKKRLWNLVSLAAVRLFARRGRVNNERRPCCPLQILCRTKLT